MLKSNGSYRPKTSFDPQNQAGVALLAVLLFLILITIAGVVAVRQSSVDLKVATSDQANVLMLNSSDSVLADIEQSAIPPTSLKDADPQTREKQKERYDSMLSGRDGIMGYFGVQVSDKIGDQVHFCYRPGDELLFSLTKARILKYGGGYDRQNNPGLETGVCDSNNPKDYTSARNTTLTQVAVKALDSETDVRFAANTRGELGDMSAAIQVPSLSIHSVSVLPALSKADNDEMTTCLGRPVGDDVNQETYGNEGKDDNMTKCLRAAGIPSVALVEDALMKQGVEGGLDAKTGKLQDQQCKDDPECAAALVAK